MSQTTAPSPTAGLSDEQLAQFHEQGYLILPAVFSDEEVRQMRTEANHIRELGINSSVCNRRKSHRLDWRITSRGEWNVRKIQPINDLSLWLTQVSHDERLIGPLRAIMQDEPVLMEEKLNYKQPLDPDTLSDAVKGLPIREYDDKFPVHNDWAYYKAQEYPQSILSSAVTMDECTPDNGPLRVWPGSHKTHLEHEQTDNGWEVCPTEIDHAGGQDALCPPGSVMIFHTLLVHNSKANVSGKPRRLMIYSHYPKGAQMGFDVRNGPARLREAPWERQYFRMRLAGKFDDVFTAPSVPGAEAAAEPAWQLG